MLRVICAFYPRKKKIINENERTARDSLKSNFAIDDEISHLYIYYTACSPSSAFRYPIYLYPRTHHRCRKLYDRNASCNQLESNLLKKSRRLDKKVVFTTRCFPIFVLEEFFHPPSDVKKPTRE